MTLAAFFGAALLFSLELLVGRLLLPLLGGAASVWITCLAFFQTALFLGYLYAHLLGRLPLRRQGAIHGGLLLAGLFFLPVEIRAAPPTGANPATWVALALARSIGLPFLLLSATTPLLMRWTAPREDPYPLYAAGNAGSLLGLLSYPFLVEPWIGLSLQRFLWSAAFAAWTALLGVVAFRSMRSERRDGRWLSQLTCSDSSAPPISARLRLHWILLAALPASLLLGVTTYLTTDLAPIPLLWTVPLALYLLSFVATFGRRRIPRTTVRAMQTLFVVACLLPLFQREMSHSDWLIPANLIAFFFTACACHGELARSTPAGEEATGFALSIAGGGMLGGLATALLSPIVFTGPFEYPLILGLSALFTLPPRIGILAAFLPLGFLYTWAGDAKIQRFDRSFYGIYRVRSYGGANVLSSGTTIHGEAWADPARDTEPLGYYHHDGLLGDVFRALRPGPRRIAGIGLGIGSIAGFGRPGDRFDFYEIDPRIEEIASDARYFRYLSETPSETRVLIGDGRLRIAEAPPASYDLILLDAFQSDAVPVHLLTREAIALYRSRLVPGGLLAIHLSGRYLNLWPVVEGLSADAGMPGLGSHDSRENIRLHIVQSSWAVLAAREEDLAPLLATRHWNRLRTAPTVFLWTDDRTDLLRPLVAKRMGRGK